MLTNIDAVLFDLDGTIANTNEIILRALADTLQHTTGRAWRREELLAEWGRVLRAQLLVFHPEIDLERAVPYYRRRATRRITAVCSRNSPACARCWSVCAMPEFVWAW